MGDTSKYFAIRRFVTQAVGTDGKWGTPIVCPIDCTQVVIENGDGTNAQMVRSDPTDGDTEKGIPASLELTLRASSHGGTVWNMGDTVCRVAPAAGAGPVIVTFLR